MTAIGWLQIALYCLALLLVTKPLGLYMLKVYDGSFRWLGWLERPLYRMAGIDPDEDQHWTRYAGAMLLFSVAGMLLTYLVFRLQHVLPWNPAEHAGGARPAGLRDGRVVHHQHELAVVRRGDDDVVLLADDPAHVPQLRLGRDRHGAGDRAHPRHRAPRGRREGPARELLGRHGPRHALHPAAALDRDGAAPGVRRA